MEFFIVIEEVGILLSMGTVAYSCIIDKGLNSEEDST